MKDIFDIKTPIFGFIFSYDYLFFLIIIFFLVGFFILLKIAFSSKKTEVKIDLKEENVLQKKLDFIIKNKENFSRELFYREVALFLKTVIFEKYRDKNIFTMTFLELNKKYKTKYNDILKQVYFIEFDTNQVDNLILRNEILNKIETNFNKQG